jgi:hypothetical protein
MSDNLMNSVMQNLTSLIVGSLVILAIFFWHFQLRDNIVWADFTARYWKIRKWRKQTSGIENRSNWERAGMPGAEESLCAHYFKYIKGVNRRDFDNARDYLAITHQTGRSPMALWMFVILFVLTMAEAATTGAFIAPFISQYSTGNEITYFSYGAAFVLAVMLLIATHAAGEASYKFTSIRTHIGPYASSESGFYKTTITSGTGQSDDAGEVAKVRFGNRILAGHHDRGSLKIPIIVLIVLILLLAAIFSGRVYQIHSMETKQVAQSASASCGPGGSSGSDPFANMSSGGSTGTSNIPGFGADVKPPTDVQCGANNIAANVDKQSAHDDEMSGDAASFILAIVYLLTQMAGFSFSFSHAFIADGKKAFETTRGEPSFSSYETHYVIPALNRAAGPLTELRHTLAQRVENYGRNPSNMSMQDYYEKMLTETGSRQTRGLKYEQKTELQPLTAPASAPTPSLTPTEVYKPQVSTIPSQDVKNDDVNIAARRILSASNRDEKLKILFEMAGDDLVKEGQILDAADALKAEAASRLEVRKSRLDGL